MGTKPVSIMAPAFEPETSQTASSIELASAVSTNPNDINDINDTNDINNTLNRSKSTDFMHSTDSTDSMDFTDSADSKEYQEINGIHKFPYDIEDCIHDNHPGLKYLLQTPWVLWHQSKSKRNWNVDNMKPVYRFSTIAGFWYCYHNLSFRNGARYVFMRDGIKPNWEDMHHMDGGYTTIDFSDVEMNDYQAIFLHYLMSLVGEQLSNSKLYDSSEITGMTYIRDFYKKPAKQQKELRIWVTSNKNPLIPKMMNDNLIHINSNLNSELSELSANETDSEFPVGTYDLTSKIRFRSFEVMTAKSNKKNAKYSQSHSQSHTQPLPRSPQKPNHQFQQKIAKSDQPGFINKQWFAKQINSTNVNTTNNGKQDSMNKNGKQLSPDKSTIFHRL